MAGIKESNAGSENGNKAKIAYGSSSIRNRNQCFRTCLITCSPRSSSNSFISYKKRLPESASAISAKETSKCIPIAGNAIEDACEYFSQ